MIQVKYWSKWSCTHKIDFWSTSSRQRPALWLVENVAAIGFHVEQNFYENPNFSAKFQDIKTPLFTSNLALMLKGIDFSKSETWIAPRGRIIPILVAFEKSHFANPHRKTLYGYLVYHWNWGAERGFRGGNLYLIQPKVTFLLVPQCPPKMLQPNNLPKFQFLMWVLQSFTILPLHLLTVGRISKRVHAVYMIGSYLRIKLFVKLVNCSSNQMLDTLHAHKIDRQTTTAITIIIINKLA